MKSLNILLYHNKLRVMVRREEHHRVVNDADHATKQAGLWGRRLSFETPALLIVLVSGSGVRSIQGVVAMTRLVMSCNKKPWSDYTFGAEMAYMATQYLNLCSSESEELRCRCYAVFLLTQFCVRECGYCRSRGFKKTSTV